MLVWAILLLGWSPETASALQARSLARRAVLQLVAWGGADLPWWLALDRAFRRQIATTHPGQVDYYTEYVDASRFSGAGCEETARGGRQPFPVANDQHCTSPGSASCATI